MEPIETPVLAPQAIPAADLPFATPLSPPQHDALRPSDTTNIAGPRTEPGGLTPGGIAGLIIGILCVLFLVILVGILVLRRRRRNGTSALP
jgi:hypothetical protein